MNILYKKITLFAVVVVVCGLVVIAACSGKSEEPTPKTELTAVLVGSTIFKWDSDGRFLTVTSTEDWTISVSYPQGAQTGWCSVNTMSGTAATKNLWNVWVSMTKNYSNENREATITVKFANQTIPIEVVQYSINAAIPIDLQKHVELPKIEDPEWLLEYEKGEFILEYSITKKHSKWVAWQLYHGHLGSVSRTEAWQFDPRIPEQYSTTRADFSGFDRGHLCPSADRNQTAEMNAQTFMYSNMSPQIGVGFNQGIWATLETKVRGWVGGSDTLYICSGGTVLKESDISGYTSPSSMAIPKYYFKVILRKKAATGAYDAIGFWFENKSYSGIPLSAAHAKTVREIETLTGLDFFFYLPTDIQNAVETTFNSASWGL